MILEVKAWQGDLTEAGVDAIVNPANSYGTMRGGVAKAILDKGGRRIEEEAVRHAPIPVGSAVATSGGKLKARLVIHAPTMKKPISRAKEDDLRKATQAALKCAEENCSDKIAFPGMGTGVGNFPKEKAAEIMVQEISLHKPTRLRQVLLIDTDRELVKFWIDAIKRIYKN
ncbi:MAG: macro domain-containing protein [Candidatus Aenigmarchaeota archaeon]|nr:macro domain-containing protein [Candidatus Aenigmarchaeota archaeon]